METDAQKIWQATLQELQFQMTRATFDTWLRASRGLALDGGTLTVAIRSPYAADWLEHRLQPVILRTLARHADGVQHVHFEAPPESELDRAGNGHAGKADARNAADPDADAHEPTDAEADGVEVDLVADPALAQFDVLVAGWSKLANYAVYFWSELLGPVAFLTWLAIKSEDVRKNKTPWTPALRFSVSYLARIAAGGNRQAITGVWRTCHSRAMLDDGQPCPRCAERGGRIVADHTCRYWRPGAFDVLQREGVALVRSRGEGLQIAYQVRVFNVLPLLTPAQVARLHPLTQQAHDRWLRRQDLDAAAWERLTVAHLGLPPFEDRY